MSWFHCGRCGSLFQSNTGDSANRLCPKCGFDPCPDLRYIAARTGGTPDSETTSRNQESDGDPASRKTKSRAYGLKRGKNRTLWRVAIPLVIALVALTLYKIPDLSQKTPPEKPPVAPVAAPSSAFSEEDVALLNEAMPACSQAFARFLATGAAQEGSQFVLDPISSASHMQRFLSLNPSTHIDPQSLALEGRSILDLPGSKAIETHWKSRDGDQRWDAVFRQEYGEWKLDWDHFARYSDFPWSLFLTGTGPSEGEFRLLARERLAEERKNAETISIVLYAPRFGHPEEAGPQSPEFLLERKSRDGQLLGAAFQRARSGGRVFGSRLPDLNPDGMIRVRVKVRRVESADGRKFVITGVSACHWLSVDDPGVELPPEN